MRRVLKRIIVLALLFVVLLNLWLYLQQPHMTFYPYERLNASPVDWGLSFEDVLLKGEDGVALHGWYLPSQGATKTLLFFHGNGGNISHRGDTLQIFHRLGLNVLIIDYRGYGLSEGEPDEAGLYRDARTAWHYLTRERGMAENAIIIFGRSLGGAVATHLAAEVQPAALILESTFTSAADMARQFFPLLSHVIVLRYRFDSIGTIAQVKCPILVLHSREDEVIPYRLGERLYEAAPAPKHFVSMHGGHNEGFMLSQPSYEIALRDFLRKW